jgi:hypothetical protein
MCLENNLRKLRFFSKRTISSLIIGSNRFVDTYKLSRREKWLTQSLGTRHDNILKTPLLIEDSNKNAYV